MVEALSHNKKRTANIKNYIVGLGGRDISSEMIKKIIEDSNKKEAKKIDHVKFYG